MQTEPYVVGRGDPIRQPRLRWEALAELAAEHHGVVARRELLALGFTSDEVQGMLGAFRLHPVHRGVYAVGHRRLAAHGRWMAAVLACGPYALLSHRTGAALASIRRTSQSRIEVTAPTQRRAVAAIRPYSCSWLRPHDRRVIEAIPCASPALLLLQLAAVLPRRELERACDEAEVQQLFDLLAIEELLGRAGACRGTARLRAVLGEHAIGTTLTRPGVEELALRLCDSVDIPRPVVNMRLTCRPGVAWEVDFLWRAQRLVLETDGERFHHTRRQIERDRRKESDLVRAGYRVLRATWLQIERDPRSVALMLRAAMAGADPHPMPRLLADCGR